MQTHFVSFTSARAYEVSDATVIVMGDDPIRTRVEAELVVEREGWAVERVNRVTQRLQAKLAPDERFETLVIWADHHNAFTCPGQTIYISRRLLEMLPDDDAAAFVVAHEIAHHHLGHLMSFSLPQLPLAMLLGLVRSYYERHHHERHADLHAIELCMAAGYDSERCINALNILDVITLNYGDIEGSIGAATNREAEIVRRGYPPVQDRITAVREHVVEYRWGKRIVNVLAAERAKKVAKRKQILIAASGVLVTLAIALFRRGPR